MGHPCDETRSGRITRGVPNKLSPPLASSRGKFLLLQPLNSPAQCLLAGCWAAWGEPHPTGKLFNHEEIEAGKRHALWSTWSRRMPPAWRWSSSSSPIARTFSPLDAGRAQAARQVGPASLICARCAALHSATVCNLGSRASSTTRRAALPFEKSRTHRRVLDLSVRRPGAQIVGFSDVCLDPPAGPDWLTSVLRNGECYPSRGPDRPTRLKKSPRTSPGDKIR